MGRITRQAEEHRRYLVAKYMEEGMNHHQIAKKFESDGVEGSTRPQNIKLIMDSIEAANLKADSMVASPKQQSIMLAEVTVRITEDLSDIEEKIHRLSKNLEEHALRVEKLYGLKLEYYKTLIDAWAIVEGIVGATSGVKKTGDKTQINIDKIDYKQIDKMAASAAAMLEEYNG